MKGVIYDWHDHNYDSYWRNKSVKYGGILYNLRWIWTELKWITSKTFLQSCVRLKNDDSVKEAPAYCRISLTVFINEGAKSLFRCFVLICSVLYSFVIFYYFWRTDRQTDGHTDLGIKASIQSLTILRINFGVAGSEALQMVRHCRRCGVAGGVALQVVSECPLRR